MALIELPPDRRALISEVAEEVWRTHSRERPVFLDGVAKAAGVTVSYGDYGNDFDGLLEHRGGTFHIFCNSARGQPYGSPRARFTVAHELGHYFIDEHRNALATGFPPHCSVTESPPDNPAEAEANVFAAHLLMPTSEFRKALTEVPSGLKGIIEIASTFAVSIQSAALRYTAASDKPCAIHMFRDAANPWWDISPQLKARGFHWFRKLKPEMPPDDSSTGLAIRDSAATLGDPRRSGSVASAWFGGVAKGGVHDEILLESAVRLRSHGVLTLLEPVK